MNKYLTSKKGGKKGKISMQIVCIWEKFEGDKTPWVFNMNTPREIRNAITLWLGALPTNQFEKYLGLPPIIGKAKYKAFNEMND